MLFLCNALSIAAQTADKRTSLALDYIQNGYVIYGLELLGSAASSNDLAAQFYWAECYEKGLGMEANKETAFKLYRRTAERGLPDAMFQLARCYREGIGVSANPARSSEWERRFNQKGGRLVLPDIAEIFARAQNFSQNYAANPTSVNSVETKDAQDNRQIINNITIIQGKTDTQEPPITVAADTQLPLSDVDTDYPVKTQNNVNTFALIIANENYQEAASVPFALNDGGRFAEYCKCTLGIPDSNVHLVKDATLNNIKREIGLLNKIADAYKGEAKFIIYYAGHGIPDDTSKDAYIMPIDGFATDMSTCMSLKDLYTQLGQMPTSQVIVLLDACFSGAMRNDDMIASSRGVVIKPKETLLKGPVAVISATYGDETAKAFTEKSHGLFTYFLLKKLKESKGETTLEELAGYLRDVVLKHSLVINGKSQTPTIRSSDSIQDKWKTWTLY